MSDKLIFKAFKYGEGVKGIDKMHSKCIAYFDDAKVALDFVSTKLSGHGFVEPTYSKHNKVYKSIEEYEQEMEEYQTGL